MSTDPAAHDPREVPGVCENPEAVEVVLVAAVASNGVIGAAGGMPWHVPEDLRHFRAVTMGHPLVMGRKTFEAIGRALPGRRTIVVTTDPDWRHDGVQVAASLAEALARAAVEGVGAHVGGETSGADPAAGPIMVVGGGQIYAQAMPLAHRLEITHLEVAPEGDTFFPTIDPRIWTEVRRDAHDGYAFVTYLRA